MRGAARSLHLLAALLHWFFIVSDASQPYLVAVTLSANSSDIIADALQSAVGWVDSIILIDTGTTDDTLAVAKRVAGDKLITKQMQWPGSFSDARNKALQMAAEAGGSWGVFLDTDERFEGNTGTIRGFLQSTTADMINMKHDSLTYHKPRFFRLPVRGTYIGPTHEAFVLAPESTSADISGVVFSELPKSDEENRRKAQRDVGILTNHTAANPTDPRWLYYLGDAYSILGEHEQAVTAFHKCSDLRGWDEEGAWAMYRAAQSLQQLNQFDEAIDALAKGMSRHPGMPELPWFAAHLSLNMGRFQHAAWWARLATVHDCVRGTCPPRFGFENPFARYEGPYEMLLWSSLALGDQESAAEAQRLMQEATKKQQQQSTHDPTAGDSSRVAALANKLPCVPATGSNAVKPRVAVGFTTAKRVEHFRRTYLSFRLRCLDCDAFVTDWYAVDDGSSPAELAAMKDVAPQIKWLQKAADQSGHVGSINTLMGVAADYEYFVWMEDDWFFIRDEQLITKAITVMQGSPAVAQVLFNQDYRDTDHNLEAEMVAGGDSHEVCGVSYVLHKYCGPSISTEFAECSVPGKISNYHWPHFALRPGVWSMSHMGKLGPMQAGDNFEQVHGLKYVDRGWKTAFLPSVNAIHLAIQATWIEAERPHIVEETYARHGISLAALGTTASAYDLTGTSR